MANRLRQFLAVAGKILLSSVLSALMIVGLYLILQSRLPATILPRVLATPTPQQSVTTIITSSLSYGDALHTYESVATSAIQASERALDLIKWLVGAVLALSTIATGVAAYLYRTTREAGEKAQKAESAAKEAQAAATSTEHHLNTLSQQYTKVADRYYEISRQYLELRGRTSSLGAALQAWERGEIPRDKIIEAQQWYSWYKWTQEKNKTGWLELYEVARFGDGLTPLVRAAVEMELERIQKHLSTITTPSLDEQEYRQRLIDLLGSIT